MKSLASAVVIALSVLWSGCGEEAAPAPTSSAPVAEQPAPQPAGGAYRFRDANGALLASAELTADRLVVTAEGAQEVWTLSADRMVTAERTLVETPLGFDVKDAAGTVVFGYVLLVDGVDIVAERLSDAARARRTPDGFAWADAAVVAGTTPAEWTEDGGLPAHRVIVRGGTVGWLLGASDGAAPFVFGMSRLPVGRRLAHTVFHDRLARSRGDARADAAAVLASRRERFQTAKTRCEEGRGAFCIFPADVLRDGEPGVAAADVAESLRLYRRACELPCGMPHCSQPQGSYGACREVVVVTAEGPHADLDVARWAARRGCTLEDPVSCLNAALVIEEGPEAAQMAERACEMGHHPGCSQLGLILKHGRGVPADPPRAVRLFTTSCEAGDPGSCMNLAGMYERGIGTEEDKPRGVGFFARACELGTAAGCFMHAKRVRDGEGVEADPERAQQLMRQACEMGLSMACEELTP